MIDGIKKLGLNDYEARAYKSLLQKGKDTAVQIAKSSGVPRARVYDVLFSLEKKGFVVRGASKPIEFSVVRPTKAFEAQADKEKQSLELRLSESRSIAEILEKGASFEQATSGEGAWIVEGRDNIYSRVAEEMENCKESVLISSSPEGIKRKKEAFDKKLARLSARGVRVISRNAANSRYLVMDKQKVVLFLNHEKNAQSEKALFIQSPFVANYFYSNSKK
ncbi:MAG: hypothetical protein NUV67_00725 [archaeon]|nr:hypothetical protein [archaeon]